MHKFNGEEIDGNLTIGYIVVEEKNNIEINLDKTTFKNGETSQIETNQNDLIYRSNKTNVAVVSTKGKITAIGVGNAIITVITPDGDTKQFPITVLPVEEETTVTKQSTATSTIITTAATTKENINNNPPSNIGDVNSDRSVDAKDATMILIYYANSIAGLNTTIDINIADTNGDNKADAKDATNILVYYAYSIANSNFGSFYNYVIKNSR